MVAGAPSCLVSNNMICRKTRTPLLGQRIPESPAPKDRLISAETQGRTTMAVNSSLQCHMSEFPYLTEASAITNTCHAPKRHSPMPCSQVQLSVSLCISHLIRVIRYQLPATPGHSAFPPTSLISCNLLPICTTLYRIILGSRPSVRLTVCWVLALESKRRMK